MRLSDFILSNLPKLAAAWEEFALSCAPAATTMNFDQRRDHVVGMLRAIAVDIETPQTSGEEIAKAKGEANEPSTTAAHSHGTDRAATGYTVAQMVGEFRALRASVLRLWARAEVVHDVSSLAQATRFSEAIDQALAESMETYALDIERSKDLFLGVLGHDLRTPLGSIMMLTSTMTRQEGSGWRHLKAATRILRSVDRMDAMIRDLVDFTRTRLGSGIPVVRVGVKLEEICQQTIDEVVALHPRSTVRFETSGSTHGMWDGDRLAQMLSNLIGNARQHGRGTITVSLRGEPDRVVLTVHNEGPAIEPSQLSEIFDPFRQVAPKGTGSTDPRSAGLGLYIVRATAEAHHGTVEATSGDAGTTFTVRLPRH